MQTPKNGSVSREQNKIQNSTVSVTSLTANEKLSIMEALDHIFVTRQYQEMGCCSVCKKISVKKCTGCSTFYCSSECQTFDWPKHRLNCSKGRDSLSDRSSFGSLRGMKACSVLSNFNEDSIIITGRSSPFTALANQLSKKSENGFRDSQSLSNFKIGNKQYQNRKQQFQNGAVNEQGVKDQKTVNSSNRRKNFSPKLFQNNKKFSSEEQKDKINFKSNNQVISEAKSTERVSDGGFTVSEKKKINLKNLGQVEVIAMYRESDNRYWVLLLDSLQRFEEIQTVLKRDCKFYETVQPEVGLIVGCNYNGEWFRGEVLSITPELRIHFIDYGNISKYESTVLKRLPGNLTIKPGLAFLIEFEEGTPRSYKTEVLDSLILKIEESSKAPDGIPRVNVIEGMYGATETLQKVTKPVQEHKNPPSEGNSESTDTNTIRSVMDVITPNTSGMLFFLPGEGKIRYASIVPDNHKEANECIEKILNIDCSNSPIEAEEGDYVLVTDNEGNDQRGKVITKLKSNYYIQLIDCGNVIASECVYPLPDHLKDLIELGVKVTLEEEMTFNRDLETCFFTITGKPILGKWPCTLKSTQQQIIANVFLEKPKKRVEWQPKYIYLKSGSTVEISYVSQSNALYVRPVDVETEQKFMDMYMEMNHLGPKTKSYDVPPLPGELCCAMFYEDNCFYRAVVISVENDKVFILFVDFGNEQETDLKDIKPLPKNLKLPPFFAVKVELLNVSGKPWNNMIKEYIKKLAVKNVELMLTYKDSISKGVILREKVSGVVVNDFVEKARDKTSLSDSLRDLPPSKEIFLDDDITSTQMTPGSSCTLAILYISESEFESTHTFWATSADEKNFNYVNLQLSSMISEHCEKDSTPYRPSLKELCLAEFEGSWYRAVCGGIEGDIYKVFFIDFGNICELKAESIRKMQKEFIKAPALVVNCTLNGHERLKGNSVLTKEIFNALLSRINTFINETKVVKFEEELCVLEIPEIEAMFQR